MVPHFQEQESLLQNSIFDALYCEEERFDGDLNGEFGFKELDIDDFNEIHEKPSIFVFEHDLFLEEEELKFLLSKEKSRSCPDFDEIDLDGYLKLLRDEAIKWMLNVSTHYGFTAKTSVLAVNYYDRFITSPCFHKDKPWMSQLVAVSCLSIAAKVEEIQVPLLIDQVEESQYLFEAKTIKRMELLVLSTLQWKMNPLTPMSFIDHIVRRFGLVVCLQREFLSRCENLILSIISDCRLVGYLPSEVAAATMLYTITEIESCRALDFQNQFMSLFETNKGKIEECHKLIMEIMKDHNRCNLGLKRKHRSIPSSPSGVVDAYLSSDCSNDSWVGSSSISSSPEPVSKRSRTKEQHMRLAPLSSPG